jgi:hypothetical protein
VISIQWSVIRPSKFVICHLSFYRLLAIGYFFYAQLDSNNFCLPGSGCRWFRTRERRPLVGAKRFASWHGHGRDALAASPIRPRGARPQWFPFV